MTCRDLILHGDKLSPCNSRGRNLYANSIRLPLPRNSTVNIAKSATKVPENASKVPESTAKVPENHGG